MLAARRKTGLANKVTWEGRARRSVAAKSYIFFQTFRRAVGGAKEGNVFFFFEAPEALFKPERFVFALQSTNMESGSTSIQKSPEQFDIVAYNNLISEKSALIMQALEGLNVWEAKKLLKDLEYSIEAGAMVGSRP